MKVIGCQATTIAFALLWAIASHSSVMAGETLSHTSPPVHQSPRQGDVVPAAAPAATNTTNFENQPLMFSSGGKAPVRGGDGQAEPRRASSSFSVWTMFSMLFCVALVCSFLVAILYVAKKYLPGHRQMFSHPAMEMLGRSHIDAKRYVSLLRVGRRIIVVGVSPDEMTSLSEITDEAEITEILQVARPKSETGLTLFQRLFQRHVVQADADMAAAEMEIKTTELEEQMSSLRERVKAIREQEEPARRLDAIG